MDIPRAAGLTAAVGAQRHPGALGHILVLWVLGGNQRGRGCQRWGIPTAGMGKRDGSRLLLLKNLSRARLFGISGCIHAAR